MPYFDTPDYAEEIRAIQEVQNVDLQNFQIPQHLSAYNAIPIQAHSAITIEADHPIEQANTINAIQFMEVDEHEEREIASEFAAVF